MEYDKPCTRAQLSRHTEEAQKTYSYFFYFFISISFAVKLQARLFWEFASGFPRDKMCVFMNLPLFFFFFQFYTFSIKAYLVNCLFHCSSVCISFKLLRNPTWIWAIEDTFPYVLDSMVMLVPNLVFTTQNQNSWRFCLLIMKMNWWFQHNQPTIFGINLETQNISSTQLPAQLLSTSLSPSSLFADLAPGWQKRKHREHPLPIAFQHRDRSADHL